MAKTITEAPVLTKRAEAEPDHPQIPAARQCELLDLNRSTFYYAPASEDPETQVLMRQLNKEFTLQGPDPHFSNHLEG